MIIFQDKNYRTREVFLSDFGQVLISTDKLNNKLLNKVGSYISEEARVVDEQIFYFVNESEIKLPTSRLVKILIDQLK